MIFFLILVPEVSHFLEWTWSASSSPHPVLGLFWPLVAFSYHLLIWILLIWSVPIISKILNMDLPMMDVHLNPNRLCFPYCPGFVLFLVKKENNIEYLPCVRLHTEGFTWRPRWTPLGSQALVSASPLDSGGRGLQFALEDAGEPCPTWSRLKL